MSPAGCEGWEAPEPDELEELGWEEYFYSDGAYLVEWPERADGLLPAGACTVTIRRGGNDPDLRQLDIEGFPEEILESL